MMTDFESARVRDYSKGRGQIRSNAKVDPRWPQMTLTTEYQNVIFKVLLRQEFVQTFL